MLKVAARPPLWMLVLAAAFASYYSLLLHSDLNRPEPIGLISQIGESGASVRAVANDSPAGRAGLQVGDRVVEAEGHPIRDRLDWLLFDSNLQIGRPVQLIINRDGESHSTTLVLERVGGSYWLTMPGATLLSARAVQFITLLLAIFVAFKRPFDRSARMGSLVLATLAVYSIVWPSQIASTWRSLPLILGASLWIPFTGSLAIAAILFSFFALFPRSIVRSGWVWFALWAPVAVVLFFQLDFAARAVYRPASTERFVDWTTASVVVTTMYALAAAVSLVAGYRRLTDVTDRRRVRVLVIGSCVGLLCVMPVTGVYWWPSNDSLEDSIFVSPLAAASVMLGLALPISFAHAILRHRLFDVRFIIRRGLQYALARRGLVSIVPIIAAVFLLDLWTNRSVPFAVILQTRGWVYIAFAGLAVIARLRRDRWLDGLDRRFFREHYNAQRLLRAIGADVRDAAHLEAVASRLVTQIDAAIHPEWVALVARLPPDRSYRAIAIAPDDKMLEPFPPTSTVIALLRLLQKPVRAAAEDRVWLARHLPGGEIDALDRSRTDLIVPVQLRKADSDTLTPEALFALGPKRSEEPYSAEDEDLLMAIGASIGALLTRDHLRPQAEAQFEECPVCGACYEAGAGRCLHDGTELIAVPLQRVLAGRYRLDRRIGRGGMGTVYAAYDMALERKVAAKLLREDLVDGPTAAERFQSEARLAAALAHPNVVIVYDIGVTPSGRAFFVMELLEGITLREELHQNGKMQPARGLRLLSGICAAVAAAHERQLIHRDLKPDNIILSHQHSSEVPKVLDFGLAKALEASGGAQTRAGLVAGTPQYMAPEHLRGGEPSPDWDLWALSVIAFEMITGAAPTMSSFGATQPTRDLPVEVRQFFERAFSLNPIDRPTSAEEFLSDLERVLLHTPDTRHELQS